MWEYISNADGFGGNTTQDTKIGDSWANIETIPTDKLTDYGLDETQYGIRIKCRKRSDIDLTADNIFFKYKGIEYAPQSVTDRDLHGLEIEFVASGRNS